MGDWDAVKPYVLDALYALPDQVWFATPDLRRVLFSSRSFEEMYGLSLDELYRDPASPLALTDRDDTGEIARALETGRPSLTPREYEYAVTRPDGTERVLRLRTIPLLDDDGELRMLAGVTEDVTERVRAVAEVRRLDELATTILDTMPDSVALIGPDDRIRYVNRALRLSARLGDDDYTGRPVSEVLPRRDPILYEIADQVRSDGRTRTVTWFESHLGRWLETTMSAAGDDIVSMSTDRTEEREAEARERRWAEASSRADRLDALGRMAGGIAHDVGNLARLALSGLDDVAAALRAGADPTGALADATHATERALAITHQLLAFSRGAEGPPRPVNLDAVVSRMRPLVIRTMGDEVSVAFDLDARGAEIMSDEARLEQVVLNLATNARTAMPDGGRFTISTEVRPASPDGETVVLRATDTGRGMSPDTVERAFEPFFTTDQAHGTGLGLSSVYATAVEAGGLARLDSTEGVGTTVVLELPVVTPSATDGVRRVLLVDSFGPDSDATLEMLEISGYDVNRMTPSRIVAELDRHPRRYGLVVLDPLVDGAAGVALLRQIRALHPNVPVVLLSGRSTNAEFGDDARVSFVRPPYGHAELRRAVEDAFER